MSMLKYVIGRADIVIEGENIERFLCQIKNEFTVYDIIRQNDKKIFLTIDFTNLSNIFAKNSNKWYNITVVKTYGVLPMLYNLRKRWALVIGMLLLVIVPIVLSMFLWQVDISAKNEGDIASVRAQIDKLDLIAKPKSAIDKKQIEDYLYLSMDNITFVNCRFEGVNLKVTVAFSIDRAESPASADVVLAKKSGTVQSIIVYSGKAVVKIGDKVKQGDTLIVGDIDGHKVAAAGEVLVSNTVDYSYTVPKQKIEYVRSGNYVDKTNINMILFESNVRNEISYEKYETEQFWYYPFLNNLLPIKIQTTRYYELVKKVTDSEFNAKQDYYVEKAKIDALGRIVGECKIKSEIVQIENLIDCDVVNIFFEYIQNAC